MTTDPLDRGFRPSVYTSRALAYDMSRVRRAIPHPSVSVRNLLTYMTPLAIAAVVTPAREAHGGV